MARMRTRIVAVTIVVGFGAASLLGAGIAHGDLPMNIALSGQPFTATVHGLTGSSVAIYPRATGTTESGTTPSVTIKLASATITDLCLSMVAHGIPVIGDATVTVRSPGPSTHAENLVIDAIGLGGQLTVGNLVIGADLSTTSSSDANAARVGSAIVAGSAVMTTGSLTARSLRASSLTLSNFDVDIQRGSHTC